MCGIFGYAGRNEVEPIIVDGLQRLEYRGYDSAGLATLTGPHLHVRKRGGRIANLVRLLRERPAPGCVGIGHTRWATHGPATDHNAHPHVGGDALVAVVHNGIIENFAELRARLEAEGVVFRSDTDTEVIAQLIAQQLNGDLHAAVVKVLPLLKGTYALAAVSPRNPDLIVGARLGSPLVLGVGENGNFLASDPNALGNQTDKVVFLGERQTCRVTPDSWQVLDANKAPISARIEAIDWQGDVFDKGDFEHYMLKEIYEQPEALENCLRGRLDRDEADLTFTELNRLFRNVERVVITGCGTSYHAALAGEYLIEQFARIPVDVEYASEFRYRNAPLHPDTLVVSISQSGETADTLAAQRECQRTGFPVLALCNVPGSTIAREADGVLYLHAGAEIGVASTKAFTSQVAVLAMLAIHLGRMRHLSQAQGARMLRELKALPDFLRQTLRCCGEVRRIAERFAHVDNMLYLGRQHMYPVALEGALKLKEISYIHAEGYPAAEMKHGPIALVDEETPSVFLMPRGPMFHKVMSNLMEIKARQGPVIAIACEQDANALHQADEVICVPEVPEYFQPVVTAVPLQLLAYFVGLCRGCNVDRPRNLAKSVTVE
jgi:glutamine---fructose-6-phosphate transaminase (isomerizing)